MRVRNIVALYEKQAYLIALAYPVSREADYTPIADAVVRSLHFGCATPPSTASAHAR
jgi:hypothetical protein